MGTQMFSLLVGTIVAIALAGTALILWLRLRRRTGEIARQLERLDERFIEVGQQSKQAVEEVVAARTAAENAVAEVRRAVEKLTAFDEYFRSVFEKQLGDAFQAFDQSVTDVLGAMRGELERGIQRIDEIKQVVESRTRSELRLTESAEGVKKLVEESTGEEAAPAEQKPQETHEETQPDDDSEGLFKLC